MRSCFQRGVSVRVSTVMSSCWLNCFAASAMALADCVLMASVRSKPKSSRRARRGCMCVWTRSREIRYRLDPPANVLRFGEVRIGHYIRNDEKIGHIGLGHALDGVRSI
jgi:hypothetical protein